MGNLEAGLISSVIPQCDQYDLKKKKSLTPWADNPSRLFLEYQENIHVYFRLSNQWLKSKDMYFPNLLASDYHLVFYLLKIKTSEPSKKWLHLEI